MEATGHYWQNLFAALAAAGVPVALLNPLRKRRFCEIDLERTKTDAIGAVGIARFAAQKCPPATRVPESATLELRELVRLRDRLVQDVVDRKNQLHRLVELGFPEFIRYVKMPESELAGRHPARIPYAAAFAAMPEPACFSRLPLSGNRRNDRPSPFLCTTVQQAIAPALADPHISPAREPEEQEEGREPPV